MSRRKRKRMKRAIKRNNIKPITLARRDIMIQYNLKLHNHTLKKLHKVQRNNHLLSLLTRSVNLGDVATIPLVNFITEVG